MADTSNLTNYLKDVAKAIKNKKGTDEPILAANFDIEIETINVGVDTSDASATAEDISYGATAYVNGEKIRGTVSERQSGGNVTFASGYVFDDYKNNNIQTTGVNSQFDILMRVGSEVHVETPYADVASAIGLTSDKIVSGNTVLGVEGTAEAGNSGERSSIKLFTSSEDMYSDEDKQENDIAVVYYDALSPLPIGLQVSNIHIPYQVNCSESELPTYNMTVNFTHVGGTGYGTFSYDYMEMDMGDMGVEKDYNISIRFYNGSDTVRASYRYYSQGYFRRTSTSPSMTSDQTLLDLGGIFELESELPPIAQKFIQIQQKRLDGIFVCSDGDYLLAETQFTAGASDIYAGKSGYGVDGVVTGTLGSEVDGTINDSNFKLYNTINSLYADTDIVLTDTDKTIPSWFSTFPIRADGTPVINTSQLTNMDRLFYDNEMIREVILDCSNAKSMERALSNAPNLKRVTLLNTNKVTNFDSLFFLSNNVEEINDFDTSSATDLASLFYQCKLLKRFPNIDYSKTTTLYYTFRECISATQEDFPDFNEISIPNVTDLTGVFNRCPGLISAPQFKTNKIQKVVFAFSGCENLEYIPVYNFSGCTGSASMMGFIENCPKLTDESLNNVMESLSTATSYYGTKTLAHIGFSEEQVVRCQSLSNYQTLIDAGWTTGY